MKAYPRGGKVDSKFLGYDLPVLHRKGASFTAQEIQGQPLLWQKTYQYVKKQKNQIREFLERIFPLDGLSIVLTGAGTSAYIGDTLEGPIQRKTGIITRAIATTDIVTHPNIYLPEKKPVLLISFARSGNSPESVQAVKIADAFCNEIYHLFITCNPNGQLAKCSSGKNSFAFILPPEADDQSLAMTGSFSSMLLAALLISEIHNFEVYEKTVIHLVNYGNCILNDHLDKLKYAASLDFIRAVFLGSGPLRGIARESHLKLQELTDGKVICKHDSYLGFRHGPKAVVDNRTLMVYLLSNNPYVQKYETDLIHAVNKNQKGIYRIALTEHKLNETEVDLLIQASCGEEIMPEEFWSICSVLPAQIIGFFKSINLGFKPDSPSESGTITRVVEGVNIYPYLRT